MNCGLAMTNKSHSVELNYIGMCRKRDERRRRMAPAGLGFPGPYWLGEYLYLALKIHGVAHSATAGGSGRDRSPESDLDRRDPWRPRRAGHRHLSNLDHLIRRAQEMWGSTGSGLAGRTSPMPLRSRSWRINIRHTLAGARGISGAKFRKRAPQTPREKSDEAAASQAAMGSR